MEVSQLARPPAFELPNTEAAERRHALARTVEEGVHAPATLAVPAILKGRMREGGVVRRHVSFPKNTEFPAAAGMLIASRNATFSVKRAWTATAPLALTNC